jgi:hypothetical protein
MARLNLACRRGMQQNFSSRKRRARRFRSKNRRARKTAMMRGANFGFFNGLPLVCRPLRGWSRWFPYHSAGDPPSPAVPPEPKEQTIAGLEETTTASGNY